MLVKLPKEIDYSKYQSNQGMATKFWGPSYWNALFISIMGRYPIKINKSKEHNLIKKQFKMMLIGLKDTLPCVFCRNSFKQFLKEIPIESFLVGRIELMYWLYLIKDKVNLKLINQEKICYEDEKKRLRYLYDNKKISRDEYYKKIKEFKKITFKTIPSPPFEEVLDTYEKYRAACSKKSLSCIISKNAVI